MKYYFTNELYHHGIKGQKWGIRRYQRAFSNYKSARAKYKVAKSTGASREERKRLKAQLKESERQLNRSSQERQGEILSKQGKTVGGEVKRSVANAVLGSIGGSAISAVGRTMSNNGNSAGLIVDAIGRGVTIGGIIGAGIHAGQSIQIGKANNTNKAINEGRMSKYGYTVKKKKK